MPKHDMLNPPGHQLTQQTRKMLSKHFSELQIRKLERLGGRITISITAPYAQRNSRRETGVVINEAFLDNVNAVKHSRERLQDILNQLTVRQLRQLGELIRQPLRSSATAGEIRSALIRNFESEALWNGISGTTKA